jgi:hypothetical protein
MPLWAASIEPLARGSVRLGPARPDTDVDHQREALDPSIPAVSASHAAGARVVCDNTFMSPYLQRPLEFGVDIVVHSTTKFLNGHSDGIGGAVVLNNEDDANWIAFIQNSAGAILSPFDSWLVMRGTKTLALRMAQHSANGMALAQFLQAHHVGPVPRQPLAELRLASADAVDVPGGDLHLGKHSSAPQAIPPLP